MWIKNERDQIHNLTHARLIELFPASDDGYQIVAHFVGSENAGEMGGVENPLFVELCGPRPEKEARHILERICGALDGKDGYLDITRIR
jgi:hypothetical protein